MADDIDTIFEWRLKGDSKPNHCRVRIYWITWDTALVIASNITYYPDRKISDATDEIIRFVTNIHDLVPGKLMLVEHYPSGNLLKEDLYLQVLRTSKESIRYDIERSKILNLIGKPV